MRAWRRTELDWNRGVNHMLTGTVRTLSNQMKKGREQARQAEASLNAPSLMPFLEAAGVPSPAPARCCAVLGVGVRGSSQCRTHRALHASGEGAGREARVGSGYLMSHAQPDVTGLTRICLWPAEPPSCPRLRLIAAGA